MPAGSRASKGAAMKKNIEVPKIDKAGWKPGPWQDEPDRMEWEFMGYPCLMRRNSEFGNWCGYVAVPPQHPWFKLGYNDIDVSVHGGLTYTGHCQGDICHVPEPGKQENVWWLGFDCAHCGDYCPGLEAQLSIALGRPSVAMAEEFNTYRDVAYVKKQVERLVRQIHANRAGPHLEFQ